MSKLGSNAPVADVSGLGSLGDNVLQEIFEGWDGASEVEVPGGAMVDGEDVYWELNRRGIAPPI